MQKTATGKLRWLPNDFLRQELDDTLIAICGYLDEKVEEERIARRLGLMAVSPYTDKGFDIYKYWPIAGDDEINKQSEANKKATLLQKLRQHKVEEQKKQNASN